MKNKKNKSLNINQKSFFFEDYLSINQKLNDKKNLQINEDRIYLLFFSFFSLILIFSFKIIFISFQNYSYSEVINYEYKDNEQKYVNALKNKYNLDLDEIKIEKNYSNFDEMKKSTLYQEKIGDDGIGAWKIYEKMRSENFRVSLDGRGPDELMGGYNEYQTELSRNNFLNRIVLSNIKKAIKKIIRMKSDTQSKFLYFNLLPTYKIIFFFLF